MKQRAREAEKRLAEPAENYREVLLYVVRSGRRPPEQLLARFQASLKEAETPRERAALQYLIGETHYWGTLRAARSAPDINAVRRAPAVVIPALLDAFETLREAPAGEQDSTLRADIIARLRRLATTNLFGASLSDTLKKEMITRFINPLVDAEDGPSSWPMRIRAPVYRNLGIENRLDLRLPEKMPEKSWDVSKAMVRALDAGRPREALRFARELDRRCQEGKVIGYSTLYKVVETYQKTGSPGALALLKSVVPDSPHAYLKLYEVSLEAEPDLSAQERLQYIYSYIEAIVEAARKPHDPNGINEHLVGGHPPYLRAARFLMTMEEHRQAMKIIAEHLPPTVKPCEDSYAVKLWYCKAVCYENLGEKKKAIRAYRHCISEAKRLETAPSFREASEHALSRLEIRSK
jgi:tetratricopeptide (TPR) repeat protein